jgi:hypothetical protein
VELRKQIARKRQAERLRSAYKGQSGNLDSPRGCDEQRAKVVLAEADCCRGSRGINQRFAENRLQDGQIWSLPAAA